MFNTVTIAGNNTEMWSDYVITMYALDQHAAHELNHIPLLGKVQQLTLLTISSVSENLHFKGINL
jgi:hypothetical protein